MTKYYSRSKGKFIDIANMPDQYVRNAFVKMCSTNENSLHEINQDRFELQKQVKENKDDPEFVKYIIESLSRKTKGGK